MAEVTKDLIHAALRPIEARLSSLDHAMAGIKTGLRAVCGHMLAVRTDIGDLRLRVEKLDPRVGRIERRLVPLGEPAE